MIQYHILYKQKIRPKSHTDLSQGFGKRRQYILFASEDGQGDSNRKRLLTAFSAGTENRHTIFYKTLDKESECRPLLANTCNI